MKIAIIDAQGAGIAQAVIKKIRKELISDIYIYALGTNNIATSNMLKSGANLGITGEDLICSFLLNNDIDALIGPIGILISGGIDGEITHKISELIFNSNCEKYIIPLKKHGIYIPGTKNLSIKEIINEIVDELKIQLISGNL